MNDIEKYVKSDRNSRLSYNENYIQNYDEWFFSWCKNIITIRVIKAIKKNSIFVLIVYTLKIIFRIVLFLFVMKKIDHFINLWFTRSEIELKIIIMQKSESII